MAEKIIFEYVASDGGRRDPSKVKVRMKTSAPWPAGFINTSCCEAMGWPFWNFIGAQHFDMSTDKKDLRETLDTLERMYTELYEEDSE